TATSTSGPQCPQARYPPAAPQWSDTDEGDGAVHFEECVIRLYAAGCNETSPTCRQSRSNQVRVRSS
ncbi:MAG: hypothetical protein ACKPKO_39515, partial [Candidatus Fonsibacter sp.]